MMKTMRENNQKQVDRLKKEHEIRVNKLIQDHEAALAARDAREAELQAEIESLKSDLAAMTQQRDDAQGQIDEQVRLREEAEAKVQGALDEMEATKTEYDNKTQQLEREY